MSTKEVIPKLLSEDNLEFPDPNKALKEPNGLLAIGGDLSPERLLLAYQQGIFPWYNKEDPILWWCPDPRAVLFINRFKPSRSLLKRLRKTDYRVTFDQSFAEVIRACAAPRTKQIGTWITEDMIKAYCRLHQLGYAHSVEIWMQEELVGGIYGVSIGKIFCGESMFSRKTSASKMALYYLIEYLKKQNFILIDCQIQNPHLASLGAVEIPRHEFLKLLHLS